MKTNLSCLKAEAFNHKTTAPTVNHGGGNVVLYVRFAAPGPGAYFRFKNNKDALKDNVRKMLPSESYVQLGPNVLEGPDFKTRKQLSGKSLP